MDVSTIFAVQGGLLLVSAITLVINWRMNPSLPETRMWAFSMILMIASAFLLSVYMVPVEQATAMTRIFVIIGNVVYALSFMVLLSGARCVVARNPLTIHQFIFIVGLIGVAQTLGDVATDSGHVWRPAISTSCLTLINGAIVWTLVFSDRPMTGPKALLAAFTGLVAAMLGLRSILLILNGFGANYSDALTAVVPFYVVTVMISGFTVCFILLTVHALHEELRSQADRDPLTGTLNRRAFYNVTAPIIAMANRDATPVAVAMFDLDHFKDINDTYGHLVGDDILKTFVKVATKSLRDGDVFARFGGEEFVALFVGTTREDTIAAVERVRTAFADAATDDQGNTVQATVSIGVFFLSDESTGLETALHNADEALYKAKEDGRDRSIIFDGIAVETD